MLDAVGGEVAIIVGVGVDAMTDTAEAGGWGVSIDMVFTGDDV